MCEDTALVYNQDIAWYYAVHSNGTQYIVYVVPSSLKYKTHQIPTLKRFSYCFAAVFAKSLKARCWVENEDVVGAAPTGDAPTTSEWSTIWLPTKVRLILEVLRYIYVWLTLPEIAVFDSEGISKLALVPLTDTSLRKWLRLRCFFNVFLVLIAKTLTHCGLHWWHLMAM